MATKETTQLIRALTAQGFAVRRAKSGHYRVTGPSGDTVTIPSSPSGGKRSMANQRAGLRRIGAVL